MSNTKVSIGSEWVGYGGNVKVKVTGVRQSGLSGLTMIKYEDLESGLSIERNIGLFIGNFTCVSEEPAPSGSVAINELWKANCDGTICEVVDIEVDDGVTWIVTENEDAVECDTLADFFKSYEFLSYGDRAGDEPAREIKHGHYQRDVSQYNTIDIYDICDLYVEDNSGCIQHAVKKLLCSGKRGVKDEVKDIQEAVDTLNRKLELLGVVVKK